MSAKFGNQRRNAVIVAVNEIRRGSRRQLRLQVQGRYALRHVPRLLADDIDAISTWGLSRYLAEQVTSSPRADVSRARPRGTVNKSNPCVPHSL